MKQSNAALIVLLASLFVTKLAFADAATDYAKNCKVCHGADGKGRFAFDSTKTDNEMKDAIKKGATSKDGKVKMKAFVDIDSAAMIQYIRSLMAPVHRVRTWSATASR